MNKQELDFAYCSETIALKQNLERNFLELGAHLLKIHDERLYLGQFEEFGLFLEEMQLDASVASRLMSVYKTFVVKYGIHPDKILKIGGWSNAYRVSKVVKSREEAENLLEKLSLLPSQARNVEIAEKATGIKQEECLHPKMYKICVCPDCRYKEKIYDEK